MPIKNKQKITFDIALLFLMILMAFTLKSTYVSRVECEENIVHRAAYTIVKDRIRGDVSESSVKGYNELRIDSIYKYVRSTPIFIKNTTEGKLYFLPGFEIAYWVLFNLRSKKVVCIKPDCVRTPFKKIRLEQKYKLAYKWLKSVIEHMDPYLDSLEYFYVSVYKEDPPQWIIDSLQRGIKHTVAPVSMFYVSSSEYVLKQNATPGHSLFVDSIEITSCVTAELTAGTYGSKLKYEIYKEDNDWKLGGFYNPYYKDIDTTNIDTSESAKVYNHCCKPLTLSKE